MKPTYEELSAENKALKERIKFLEIALAKALKKISELEEKINKNSKNSSKPPSSDQKANLSSNTKKKRKSRKGLHRGTYPREKIDKVVVCKATSCPCCGSESISEKKQASQTLQQAELPSIQAIITEYKKLKYHCNSCEKNFSANLPAGIPNSAFGTNLMGLVASLTGVYHLAKREAVELIKNLYDVDIGLGSILNIEAKVKKSLDPIYNNIHNFVLKSNLCKHFDETTWRDSGKHHYVWLASCKEAAFYKIDRRRNTEAFLKLSKNIINFSACVTDRYAVYNILKGKRQYCIAHLIRDFKNFAQRDGPDGKIGFSIENSLRSACKKHRYYQDDRINLVSRNSSLGYYKNKIEKLLEDGIANGGDKLFKLCTTLLDNYEKVWAFAKNPEIEPTNNLAERDLRKLVIWRKKSFGTRSERGKNFVERITSISQTIKRQKKNVLKFIQKAVVNNFSEKENLKIYPALGF
jgi:transposase